MTSIEYKNGMVQALKDLKDEIGEEFWSNESYWSYLKDGIPKRESKLLYVRICKMIIKRILAIEAEINQELDEMSKQA